MKISFRLRLALLISLLTAAVLIIFSAAAWWKIRDAKMDALESDMSAILQREVAHPRSPDQWKSFHQQIANQLTIGNKNYLHIIASDDQNTIRFNSTSLNEHEIIHLPWQNLSAFTLPPPQPRAYIDLPPGMNPPPMGPPPHIQFVSINLNNSQWYMGLATTLKPRLAIAISQQFIDKQMQPIRDALFISIPLALFLLGAIAWWLSYRALQPITQLSQEMSKMSAQDLKARINIHSPDYEFTHLIDSVNHLLERLEASFHQAIRFSGDAAHELKTPLAIIQGQLEQAVQTNNTNPATQAILVPLIDEVRRLSIILRKLLLLSQADAGQLSLQRQPFFLSLELENMLIDSQLIAPHLSLNIDIAPDLIVLADTDLLHQALQNVISNAIKYNVQSGSISLTAKQIDSHIVIEINNTSQGIKTHDAPYIFDRFYRGDVAHNRDIDGLGLGLSLVKEIIRAHSGSIILSTNTINQTGFTITLPHLSSRTRQS
jgi:heavy metal sensor kinase